MGLDIYVGTLSRYYSGDWETIIQQMGYENGLEVQIIRANDLKNSLPNQDKVREKILNWQGKLSNNLQNIISVPLEWNESAEAPYFTDKPDWEAYISLLLWASYAEHPELLIPTFMPEDASVDPAYRASIAEGFQSNYDQLINGAELWLPCDFGFTFPAVDVNGNDIVIGSTKALLAQLDTLNKATWDADKATLEAWQQAGAENGASLETFARFAFSIFYWLAKLSVINQLPMKLDY